MPEILHRCVEEVMGKGHDEQSAYAICRTTLGLLSDGSQDAQDIPISEDEMRRKVEMTLTFRKGEVLLKRMLIARPIGKFDNGANGKGVITKARLAALVEKQKKYPRQIPIYLMGDHPETNDQRPADGYVEALSLDSEGNLWADPAKLNGTAADWVANDKIRGASIYTRRGKDYDGEPIGEFLKHVLLSDEAFMRDINVAASRSGGAESPGVGFTAFAKEATMADDPKNPKPADPPDDLALKVKTLEGIVEEKMRENQELTAANANLMADVERFKSAPGLAEAANEILALKRVNRANTIRRKVKDGVAEGRFDRSMVGDPKAGYDHPSDEGVLLWFKTSLFKDSEDKLDFALVSFPRKNIGKTYQSGAPIETPGEVNPTPDDKAYIRSLGKDPDRVIAAMKAKDSEEFVALTAKKE